MSGNHSSEGIAMGCTLFNAIPCDTHVIRSSTYSQEQIQPCAFSSTPYFYNTHIPYMPHAIQPICSIILQHQANRSAHYHMLIQFIPAILPTARPAFPRSLQRRGPPLPPARTAQHSPNPPAPFHAQWCPYQQQPQHRSARHLPKQHRL